MNRFVLAALGIAAFLPSAAEAQAADAAGTVRGFYVPSIWNPLEEGNLSPMTGPALALFQKSAKMSAESGETGCVDFVVTVGGQDYDDQEIARTVRTEETGTTAKGDTLVTALFRIFPDDPADQEIRWTMREVDGAWKVADIESPEGDWRLSTLPCE